LTIRAQKLARPVSYLLKRDTAFDLDQFLNEGWRGVGEPAASLGHHGISLETALCHDALTASANAHAHLGAVR
jgi:hypothetical protein